MIVILHAFLPSASESMCTPCTLWFKKQRVHVHSVLGNSADEYILF